ncbi:MAG: TPM domain-containing protein [Bacteroidales bacterium]|nr:TPM domain-containing protein [Bacteroidales bacterium]
MRFLSLFVAICLMVANMACGGANQGTSDEEDISLIFVNDYAKLFTTSQWDKMENRLESLDSSTGNQVVVVTLTDLDGYDNALDYGVAWGNAYGVGQKDKNNGVVIVVKVKNETKGETAIATGLGMEEILPDSTCQHIVDLEMIPHFKNNDYYTGIEAALDVVIPIVTGAKTSQDYEKTINNSLQD